jgi:hypothetical protein
VWAHQAAWRRSVDSFWAAVWPGSETAWMPITSAGQTSHALRSIGLASCRVRGDRWVTSHTTAAGGRVSRQSRHCGGQGSLLGQTQHRSRLTRMHMPFISSHCTHGGILVTFPQCVETLNSCTIVHPQRPPQLLDDYIGDSGPVNRAPARQQCQNTYFSVSASQQTTTD